MTIHDALKTAPIDRSDAELLLAHALHQNRTWLLAHNDDELAPDECGRFEDFVRRRRAGEPVAYIRGLQEFHGRSFIVTKDVLIPRPATEALIDCVEKTFASNAPNTIDADTDIVCASAITSDLHEVRTLVDIGTGSGCIAITLAHLFPTMRIVATDTSAAALRVARENADRLGVGDRIDFREGSLIDPIADMKEPFFVVSNPPYVSDDAVLPPSVKNFEPPAALFGGKNGTELIAHLLKAINAHPACRGYVLECRSDQWERIRSSDGNIDAILRT